MINEDLEINIKSNFTDAINDIKSFNAQFEKLGNMFDGISARSNSVKKFTNYLINASEPIKLANQQMELLGKQLSKLSQKKLELVATGATQEELRKLDRQIENTKRQMVSLNEAVKGLNQAKFDKALKQPTIKAQNNRLNMADTASLSKQYSVVVKTETAWDRLLRLISDAGKTAQRTGKQMEGLAKSTQKSATWYSKLAGRIRNISIYRAIRSGIKWLTSGVQEGLNNLAQYSDSVNSTMSNLNASLNQIKNTLGIAFASVLQALEPLITVLADALVNLVNSFNLAMAKMRGENVYTKAKKNVEDYAQSLQKANRLSFDSFEVLSGDTSTPIEDMFEDGNVNEDANELSEIFEQLLSIIKELGTAFKEIWKEIQPLIKPLLGAIKEIIEPIKDIIVQLIPPLTEIITALLPPIVKIIQALAQLIQAIMPILTEIINAILPILTASLEGIAEIIGFIADLLTGNFEGAFEHLKNYFKAFGKWIIKTCEVIVNAVIWIGKALVNSIIGAINMTIDLFNLILKPLDWIVKMFGGKTDIQIPKVPYLDMNFQTVSFAGFANGGIPDKSELFYMNEYGVPEALVNTGGSQTNVINIDQLSEGMRRGFVQAIYETGLNEGANINIVLDGSRINNDALARAIFPALRQESIRRGGNQL